MTSTNGSGGESRPAATRSRTKRSGETRTAAPGTVRAAGVIVAIEGLAALVLGVVELIRGITGSADTTTGAYGMAFWMIPMGLGVLAGGAVSQGRPELFIPLIVVSVAALGLLFSPQTVAWLEGEYRRD